jgi:hypothetical protein
MTKRNVFGWRSRSDDGRTREVRAQLVGTRWTLTSRWLDEEDWTTHVPPLLEDLKDLEDFLFRKYQRKHTAWEHVLGVRKLIEERTTPE